MFTVRVSRVAKRAATRLARKSERAKQMSESMQRRWAANLSGCKAAFLVAPSYADSTSKQSSRKVEAVEEMHGMPRRAPTIQTNIA